MQHVRAVTRLDADGSHQLGLNSQMPLRTALAKLIRVRGAWTGWIALRLYVRTLRQFRCSTSSPLKLLAAFEQLAAVLKSLSLKKSPAGRTQGQQLRRSTTVRLRWFTLDAEYPALMRGGS
jgi:hypothetical protein